MKKRRGAIGSCFLVLGLLLLLGAGGLAGYNIWDSNRAAEASEEISTQLLERLEQTAQNSEEAADAVQESPSEEAPAETGETIESEAGDMPVLELDGRQYIGLLELVSLDLTLPVMDTWDEARLKVSPCRYAGSYLTGDLVICAHNYLTHFSGIRWMEPGDPVIFTAVDGTVYEYQVAYVENLNATQVSEMVGSETETDWDLTLFTCNTGGKTRCAVRCVLTA